MNDLRILEEFVIQHTSADSNCISFEKKVMENG